MSNDEFRMANAECGMPNDEFGVAAFPVPSWEFRMLRTLIRNYGDVLRSISRRYTRINADTLELNKPELSLSGARSRISAFIRVYLRLNILSALPYLRVRVLSNFWTRAEFDIRNSKFEIQDSTCDLRPAT